MRWHRLLRMSVGVAALGVTLAVAPACVTSGRVYVRVGPPAPVYEVRAVAPGAGYIWIDGYQSWNGRAYVWAPGRWALPPRGHAEWVPGRWQQERRGWYWTEGHWR